MRLNRNIWFPMAIAIFLFVLVFSMVNYYQPVKHALVQATFEVCMILVTYYFTALYLFPKNYKDNNKRFLYLSGLSIFLFTVIFFSLDVYILPDYSDPNDHHPPLFFHFLRIFITLGFIFFVATALSLMEQATQLKEKEKLLTEEKLATELQLLKAQINPHFIFNALNNIYSLTYMQSKNAPDSVLKLSEMLRYVFYDCSKDRVPLSSEVNYIKNFATFQQMKSDCEQNIKLQLPSNSNIEIAPMLIIPFIENAFKYSRIEEEEEALVNIQIANIEGGLNFIIENSLPDSKPNAGSGLGIENVKHRLNIIYPNKYELEVKEEEKRFRVELNLKV